MAEIPNPESIAAITRPTGDAPKPEAELVRVFDTEQESEAMVVNGLLQSAGIQSDLTSLDAAQDILPGVGGNVILVREEDAAQARELIKESKKVAAEDDTAEINISGETKRQG